MRPIEVRFGQKRGAHVRSVPWLRAPGGPGTGQRSLDAALAGQPMTLSTGSCWENKSIGCANARSSNSTMRAAPRRFGTVQDITDEGIELALRQKEALLLHQAALLEQTWKGAQLNEDLVSDLEHSPIASRTTCARPSGHAGFSAVLLEVARTSIRRRLDLLRRYCWLPPIEWITHQGCLDYGRVLRNESLL